MHTPKEVEDFIHSLKGAESAFIRIDEIEKSPATNHVIITHLGHEPPIARADRSHSLAYNPENRRLHLTYATFLPIDDAHFPKAQAALREYQLREQAYDAVVQPSGDYFLLLRHRTFPVPDEFDGQARERMRRAILDAFVIQRQEAVVAVAYILNALGLPLQTGAPLRN